jgi:HEAT repeat protein
MNNQAARILTSLVARFGTSLALDPLRCEGLLRDTCPRCNREIFVLVNAIRQQVPADLLAPRHSLPMPLFRRFLVKRLQDELAFSDEAALWAVDTWADALGLNNGSDEQETAEDSGTDIIRRVPDAVYTGTGPEQRAAWAGELESGGVEARLNAIRQLVQSSDNDSIRLLITSLENTRWRVRQAAFDALVALDELPVPFLVEALADSHEQVVTSSIIALGTIRARGAVEPLITLLDSGSEPVAYAIWALGEIGNELAITPLTKLLNSNDTRLRSEAEQALRKFG